MGTLILSCTFEHFMKFAQYKVIIIIIIIVIVIVIVIVIIIIIISITGSIFSSWC